MISLNLLAGCFKEPVVFSFNLSSRLNVETGTTVPGLCFYFEDLFVA